VTPGELRVRAIDMAIELGPKPTGRLDVRLWTEERRCVVMLLSYLADRDVALLRGAALENAGEWADPVTQGLLLDAVQEC
jgi:hypothetical protein